ncbi:DUF4129 domain-containing protein [Allomuricauda sp. SCSIO 65647]|uniref:DUF4129 domain-containing protein n=1 Tax=Allomuricauda sp. SCSIO 65647 TaxID=2908843 RepID=UPI001F1A2C2B|nr:DUF4129 domain-containing protein [Muricauda sp. SCSIO 65647]UJH66886.1 DUF4129 domain-containing protein [Muricauda sp. SCSIO 65647]
MKNLLPYIILLCFFSVGFSQTKQDSIPIDTNSELVERKLPDDLDQRYQGEEFDYEITTGKAQNLLGRFLNWLGRILRNTFGIEISPQTFKIMEYIIYGLMGLLVIFLLIRVLVNEKFNSIFIKKAKPIIDIDLSEQHIENIDLDALLNEALEKKEYRMAIRYQYLKILKRLSEKGLIDWHFEKTNSDYQREIEKPEIKARFKEVSYIYDYIWYGEQEIDGQKYHTADALFAILSNNLRD